MHFPILINWTSSFPIIGLLGGILNFYSNFKRNFCEQTVENLIRCPVLWRLMWFCTVCRCPTKRTLGLNGLSLFILDTGKQVHWQIVKTQMKCHIKQHKHQGLHCSLFKIKTIIRDRNTSFYHKKMTSNPLKYKMDNSILIVSICME